jgi:hypothetical protein
MPEGRKIGGVKLWDVEELLEAWRAIGDHLRDKSESNPFDGITHDKDASKVLCV